MHISPKTLERCHGILSTEWLSTREIMVKLGTSRDHTLKILRLLKKEGRVNKKPQVHNFNTCNKKDALWIRA